MTRTERVRYEMLQRVSDFGTTHKDRFPESSNGARAFADIARTVATIESNLAEKTVAIRESRRARAGQRRQILHQMKTIVRTSSAIHVEPSDALRLRMPKKRSDSAIINAARAFLREVEPYQAQLAGLGLPADYITDLRTAVEAFAEALRESRTGRSTVAFTRATIAAAIAEGARIASTLDVIVLNLFENDPAVMAAWTRDRRIVTWQGDDTPVAPAPATLVPSGTEPAVAAPPAVPVAGDDQAATSAGALRRAS